jgi:hypothetical protein
MRSPSHIAMRMLRKEFPLDHERFSDDREFAGYVGSYIVMLERRLKSACDKLVELDPSLPIAPAPPRLPGPPRKPDSDTAIGQMKLPFTQEERISNGNE